MQQQKVSMGKRKFRIGDFAKELKVKKYVVRFWEKEFQLKADRSEGGQRFYTKEDFSVFCLIKDLLYNRGFTISGAKRELAARLTKIKKINNYGVGSGKKNENIVGAIKQGSSVKKAGRMQSVDFFDTLKQLKKDLEELKRLLR